MALTFGTLLSSQGADAQKLDPLGLRRWLEVQLYAGFQEPPRGGSGPAALRSLEGVARQPWWGRVPRLGCHVGHTRRVRLVETGQATPAGRNTYACSSTPPVDGIVVS